MNFPQTKKKKKIRPHRPKAVANRPLRAVVVPIPRPRLAEARRRLLLAAEVEIFVSGPSLAVHRRPRRLLPVPNAVARNKPNPTVTSLTVMRLKL